MKNITLTRRTFVAASGAAFATMGGWARASVQLGDWEVTSLSDGSLRLPASLIFGPVSENPALADIQSEFGLGDPLEPPCNVTLLRNGDRNVLVDVGSGPEFQATAGMLLDALDEEGLAPDDITDVIFTHAHPDHIWGLLDDFDDLTFYNANYMMGQAEWDYWMDPNTVDTIGEERTAFAVGAARRMERIADQVSFFNDGEEILPGVAARATFGHTPGHMAFEVRGGSESLMVLGDCVGNHHVAFERPDWFSGADQDADMGAATRTMLMDQLASEQMMVLGFHLPDGGIGRVERKDSGYRFVPAG